MPTSSDELPRIEIHDVGKRYALGEEHARTSFREAVGELARHPLSALRKALPGGQERPTLWALRHLDLEVQPGEVLGVVGPNGAGKTTLLKVLSRVTDPTEGSFTLRGRTASLLAVGMGFHFELTGRENVYLSGTILGMRKKEIDRKFDEIVAFSGIEEHIDTPVKRYSAGMFVRLGFAVAAQLDAEILLVDEVLAVGDAAFRKKCIGTIGEVARGGRTIVFVSHDMGAIQQLCTRAILLADGTVQAEGAPDAVVQTYLHTDSRPSYRVDVNPNRNQIVGVDLVSEAGVPLARPCASNPLVVTIRYHVPIHTPGAALEVTLLAADASPIFSASTTHADLELGATPGVHGARVELPPNLLLPGDLHLGVALFDAQGDVLDRCEPALSFTVTPGAATPFEGHVSPRGSIHVPSAWSTLDRAGD